MSMTDPLGDMLTRIRNALRPQQVELPDAGFAPARAFSKC
jgi:ribosomal protein S8